MGKPSHEELRRAPRIRVCCRVDVRQPHGVWSGVTQDLSARGCRIVTPQLPRLGSILRMTLSSDLFPEELSTTGEVIWVTGEELGVLFLREARRAASPSPSEWLRQVLHHGRAELGADGGAPEGPPERALPVVGSAPAPRAAIPIRGRRRSG